MILKDARDMMISIITAVEAGVLSPAEAVEDTVNLIQEAKEAGINFKTDYTKLDFILIRENAAATYEVSDDLEQEDIFFNEEDEDDN